VVRNIFLQSGRREKEEKKKRKRRGKNRSPSPKLSNVKAKETCLEINMVNL
jgi:hypothetical protein